MCPGSGVSDWDQGGTLVGEVKRSRGFAEEEARMGSGQAQRTIPAGHSLDP